MTTDCLTDLDIAHRESARLPADLIPSVIAIAAYLLLLPAAAVVMALLKG